MADKESKEYAFRVAVDEGDTDAARKLLNEKPDLPVTLSAKRVWLLKDAAKKSSPKMIRWLVQEVGEDVATQDANDYTALHFAVIFDKLENAQALLELGADADLGNPLFSVPSSDLENPVAMAALLIAHGADVNQLVIEEGMPARNILTEAVDYEDSDMIEFLRSKGAKLPAELSASMTVIRNGPMSDSTLTEKLAQRVEAAIQQNRQSIEISGDGDMDLRPLLRLPDLARFEMSCGDVSDYRPLSQLTNLRTLILGSDRQSDLSPLSSLANLETLDITDGSIADLGPLAGISNLRELSFSWCSQLKDISPLSRLAKLEKLTLYECDGVTDLRPLAHCSMLEYINLTDCFELRDVSPLAKLPRLRTLILANTAVTDVDALSAVPDLKISFDEDNAE